MKTRMIDTIKHSLAARAIEKASVQPIVAFSDFIHHLFSPNPQAAQQPRRRFQRLGLLAVAETYLSPPQRGVAVEAAAGDDGDAVGFDEPVGEGDVVIPAEAGDVGHDIVGAVWVVDLEACLAENVRHEVALFAVEVGEAGVVFVREGQGEGGPFLQRRGGSDGEKVVDFSDGVGGFGRRDQPSAMYSFGYSR